MKVDMTAKETDIISLSVQAQFRHSMKYMMLKGFLSLWKDSLVSRLTQKQLLTKTDDSAMGACPLGNEIERGA